MASAIDYLKQLKPCSDCAGHWLQWCSISVRPYCPDCGNWGRVNFGSPEDAIRSWNEAYERSQRTFEKPAQAPRVLYHCTTPAKVALYHQTGHIKAPVRGFTTLQAALVWSCQKQRQVILEVSGSPAYKLPDHHNAFGEAWWVDQDIKSWKCVVSPENLHLTPKMGIT